MTTKQQLIQEIEQTPDYLLTEVLSFLRITKISSNLNKLTSQDNLKNTNIDPESLEIWEIAEKISQQIPDEEWQKLPTDLSKNLDHYLYGSDKIEE
jgi:hypothetical protein